ncbi:HIT domain-containing protein [Gallaecimonas sp. GXIMD4217]|uniref:HIT domain-containing protein n=1 Tax=Gallaecimonas sp. GXIMD4217 TaxID=3131927 RepID=UPI00311B2B5C
MFKLHAQLAADCILVGDLPLCRLLMMNDANYPWFILVPRRDGIREIYQLSEPDQQQFLKESSALSKALMVAFDGQKLNVAALGNMVPQLHVHHVVRHSHDPAWPKPIWGMVPAQPLAEAEIQARLHLVRDSLTLLNP